MCGIVDCNVQYKHVLHQTTLDSVIVSIYAALPSASAFAQFRALVRAVAHWNRARVLEI
jgi:hypothetical protein